MWPNASIVAGDSEVSFLARVVDIVDRPGGRVVHLDIVGVPEQVIGELRHARLVASQSRHWLLRSDAQSA